MARFGTPVGNYEDRCWVMHIIWLVLTGTFFFSFFHILGILTPTDEVHHFSEGMKPPTSYSAGLAHIGIVAWMLLLSLYGNGTG